MATDSTTTIYGDITINISINFNLMNLVQWQEVALLSGPSQLSVVQMTKRWVGPGNDARQEN